MRRRSFLKGGLVLSAAYPYTVSSSMTTYNTGNPIGSEAPRDLYDNAQNLDILLNHPTKTEHPDRLGVPRKTWHGMEQDFQQFLANSGYTGTGAGGAYEDYDADGPLTITALNQIFTKGGEFYRLKPGQAMPYTTTTWATDEESMLPLGDAALRQEIGGGIRRVTDLSGLKAIRGRFDGDVAYIATTHRSGAFSWVPGDQKEICDKDSLEGVWVTPLGEDGSTGAWKRLVQDGVVRLSWFLGTGTADEGHHAFTSASIIADYEGDLGVSVDVNIDLKANDPADAKGRKVVGLGSVQQGSIENSKSISCSIKGIKQESFDSFPAARVPDSNAVLLRYASDQYFVFHKRSGGGYLQSTLKNNVTTSVDSLASSSSEETPYRLVECRALTKVFVGRVSPSESSGSWTAETIPSGTLGIGDYTGGAIPQARVSSSTGDYLNFNGISEDQGRVKCTFLVGPGGGEAEILISGDVLATVSLDSAIVQIRSFFVYPTSPSNTIQIRVKVGTVKVIGINFSELEKWGGEGVDNVHYVRDSQSLDDYFMSSSANDMVVREYHTRKYGGSYHGGYSSIVNSFMVDGEEVSLSVGDLQVGRLVYSGSGYVDWSSLDSAAGAATITNKLTFGEGFVSLDCEVSEDPQKQQLRVLSLFTTMLGASPSFNKVKCPRNIDTESQPINEDIPLGRTGCVLIDNDKGQSLVIELSNYQTVENAFGGAWLWNRDVYKKVYNAYVHLGNKEVPSLFSRTNFVFK